MRLGAVILTMGNRPAELVELLESVAEQKGEPIDVVVVGNGIKASELPGLAKVRTLDLPENLGIPGGRNRGFEALLALPAEQRPEAILVLDDDGKLDGPDSAEHIRAAFTANPRLGIISFRICDPVSHEVQRRHVPRVRVGDPNHSSQVTTFLGGASAIRSASSGVTISVITFERIGFPSVRDSSWSYRVPELRTWTLLTTTREIVSSLTFLRSPMIVTTSTRVPGTTNPATPITSLTFTGMARMPGVIVGDSPDPASFGASLFSLNGSFSTTLAIRPRFTTSSIFENPPCKGVCSGQSTSLTESRVSSVPSGICAAATTAFVVEICAGRAGILARAR